MISDTLLASAVAAGQPDNLGRMTAQIGADGLDLFGDPRPELLAGVARAQPEPGDE